MGFRQAAFLCPEKTCFGNDFGGVWGVSGTNFRGGRKPFPKPSAFESEIHPTHKPSVYAPGISPCRGQIHASVNLYSPKKPDCIYPCRPEDGRIDGAAAYGYISGQMCSIAEGTSQNKAPCGCQKATAVDCPDTGIGSQTAVL